MLLLGLTGSIATGKSTVSRILADEPHNLPIVDADRIARQVVEPGTSAYREILQAFSASTPDLLLSEADEHHDRNGKGLGPPLNRAALGRRVFGDGKEHERRLLNSIVHPAVRYEIYRQIITAYIKGNWAVVLDIPLLFESGFEPLCGSIVVVAVHNPETQISRLLTRDQHLSRDEARDRVSSQWDIREKAQRCLRRGPGRGAVIWNDGDQQRLRDEVNTAIVNIRRRSPQWWTCLLWLCPPLAVGTAIFNYLRARFRREIQQDSVSTKRNF